MHYVNVKGILSAKNGMNLYRGCSHGCIYCDSRSKCYHMEHAFEDIEVKANAIELLEYSLSHKRKKCMIGTGSMTDPYIPLETELQNVSTTAERFEVLKTLRDAGIPTVVWLSPILPFINDNEENLVGILNMCIEAKVRGIICFGMGVTLREGNREYFYEQLDRSFPGVKEKYVHTYGYQYMLDSPHNGYLMQIFHDTCEKHGIMHDNEQIFAYLSTFEEKENFKQLSLWD